MKLKYMLLLNFIALLVASTLFSAPVVELGTSQVQGTKDEPGEMILLSRASVDVETQVSKFDASAKIKQDIRTSRLFEVDRGDF
ncbi:MAG: hypothetical protein KC505_04245 [Myxococcales bacterium]|nr:hypothetical protein [Myxococcales bacterium]USN50215.1 MAG: hypothetical protein H6731_08075 [Myxococcales bacterium]